MWARLLAALQRPGALAVAVALVTSVVVAVGSGALLASACTDTLVQPDDAGPFVVYEGGHPAPTMFGSPCELGVNPPERCCGEVAKEIPGGQCYGCSGKVAYALCISGAFTCACTCEPPVGYALLGPDGGGADCGTSETDGAVGDAPVESGAAETGAIDASREGSPDAMPDVDSGAIVDAHDGG